MAGRLSGKSDSRKTCTMVSAVALSTGLAYCGFLWLCTVGAASMGQQGLWDSVNRVGLALAGGQSSLTAQKTGAVLHMSSEDAQSASDGMVLAAQPPTLTGLRFYFVKDSSKPWGGRVVRQRGLHVGDVLSRGSTDQGQSDIQTD